MPIIAQSNGWTISSDLGSYAGASVKSCTPSFWIEQDIARSASVFVEVTPLSGRVADAATGLWTQPEHDNHPSLSKVLALGADNRFSLQLSTRDFDKLNAVFEIKVYQSSADVSWGQTPLVESTFTMLNAGAEEKLPSDHFEFGMITESDIVVDFQTALNKVLLNNPIAPVADNHLSKPVGLPDDQVRQDIGQEDTAGLSASDQDDFIFV